MSNLRNEFTTTTTTTTTNAEFVSAVCRRNAIQDSIDPKYASFTFISTEDPQTFYCACDSGTRLKSIHPLCYHMVGCKIGVNAVRLHGCSEEAF